MNRWIVPGSTLVAVTAATVLTATVLPSAPIPEGTAQPVPVYLTAVCPSFESATASVRVAVTNESGRLTTASLTRPDERNNEPDRLSVLTDRAEPVLVTAEMSSGMGAVSLTRSTSGPDRGLSATGCESAATQRWFSGVLLTEDAQADLVLANADTVDAAVDVTVFGPDGRINAPGSRGIVVESNSARNVPLGVMATVEGPVTLLVESSAGRVAATVRQRLWQGTTPLGTDWIPPTVAPATELVIPGIVAGEGVRELVITNPGQRSTSVAVEMLGETGPSVVPGTENLDVPAGVTRSLELSPGLAGQLAGLRLTSDQPIVAGVRQSSAEDAGAQDPAWSAALPPLEPGGAWPVPAGAKATVTLLLSNPSETEAEVTVTVGNELGGEGETSPQRVPARSTVALPVASAKTPWVRVLANGSAVRGALQVTERLGGADGLALVPLLAPRSMSIAVPPVVFDPHAAR
jgi:hypothetical protein